MFDRARIRRAGGAALLTVGMLSVLMSSGVAEPEEQVVKPGQRITVNANGFAPGATVTLRLIPTLTSQSAIANPGGHVQFLYVVPKTLTPGEYQLAIVGTAKDTSQGPIQVLPATPTDDPQPIEVVVPRVVFDPFRIAGSGVEAIPPVQRGDPDALADTGVPVQQLLTAGILLILGGAVIVFATGRRRRA